MELEITDIDDMTYCEKCGVVYNEQRCIVKKERKEWYGTDITTKCPVCKHEETRNLGDGYYK